MTPLTQASDEGVVRIGFRESLVPSATTASPDIRSPADAALARPAPTNSHFFVEEKAEGAVTYLMAGRLDPIQAFQSFSAARSLPKLERTVKELHQVSSGIVDRCLSVTAGAAEYMQVFRRVLASLSGTSSESASFGTIGGPPDISARIGAIATTTSHPNWNFEDDLPITSEVWDRAKRLMALLMLAGTPEPDISPCGDGTVHLVLFGPGLLRTTLEVGANDLNVFWRASDGSYGSQANLSESEAVKVSIDRLK